MNEHIKLMLASKDIVRHPGMSLNCLPKTRTESFMFKTTIIAFKDLESITCANVAADIVITMKSGTKHIMESDYYWQYEKIGCPQMLANTLNENYANWLDNQERRA